MSAADDPVNMRKKRLKLNQKLAQAVVDYVNDVGYPAGVDTEKLRPLLEDFSKEQQKLNKEISELLD